MKKLALWLAMASAVFAQTKESKNQAEFEVASVRLALDDGSHDIDGDKAFYKIHNLTLKRLIAQAWEIDETAIFGGPSWLNSDGYDITARIPHAETPQTSEQLHQMLQSLLVDRFHLAIHRESRQTSGYALLLAKRGSKMEPAKPDGKGSESRGSNSHLSATNVTMEGFAKRLSRNRDIAKPVVDRTGLKGGFNFALDWTPQSIEPARDSSPDVSPAIFAALQEQLGLRLESAKVPVLAVVIDRVDKPDVDQ
jgi:uncharacterized protein (TIGR03435 family)